MSNPLNDTGNPIINMQNYIAGGGNVNQLAQDIIKQNPQLLQQFQRQASAQHLSPRDFAMTLARQRGMDPAQLEQLAKMMGLKM